MKNRLVLIACAILLILPILLAAGCLKESRDPFTSTMSLFEEKRAVSISGNSAGHTAGKQSRFELALNNRSGANSWQGEFLVILIDQKGIVAEIAREMRFSEQTGRPFGVKQATVSEEIGHP